MLTEQLWKSARWIVCALQGKDKGARTYEALRLADKEGIDIFTLVMGAIKK